MNENQIKKASEALWGMSITKNPNLTVAQAETEIRRHLEIQEAIRIGNMVAGMEKRAAIEG